MVYKNKHLVLTYTTRGLRIGWLVLAGLSGDQCHVSSHSRSSVKEPPRSGPCCSHGRRQNTGRAEPTHTSIIHVADRRWHGSTYTLLAKTRHKAKPKVSEVGSALVLLKRMAKMGREWVIENTYCDLNWLVKSTVGKNSYFGEVWLIKVSVKDSLTISCSITCNLS